MIEPDTLPAGWKFNSSIVTASVTSGADDLDLTEEYGEKIKKVDGSKISGGVEIIANDSGNSIKGGKGDDVIKSGAGNDTVSLGGGNDIYIYSGGNDLIQDYTAGADTIQFETKINSAKLSGKDLIIYTDEGNVTVKNGQNKNVAVEDSTGNFTILNQYPAPIIGGGTHKKGTAGKDTFNAEDISEGDTIEALGEVDKIVTENNNISINAGAGNDKITIESGAESVTILGGVGNDYIDNSGSGNLYQYADGDGKDTIIGYSEDDTLHITKGSYTSRWLKSDLIITVGKGSITLKDVGDKTVRIKNSSGKIEDIENESLPDGWKYSEDNKKLTATGDAENIDLNKTYGKGVVTVDGSKSGGIEIIGNANANSIKGGKGENTLDGGDGNDILIGSEGYTDYFVYNDGDDIIKGYEYNEDVKDFVVVDIVNVQNRKKDIERYISDDDGDDIIYNFTKLAAGVLTVQGSNGKSIKLVDTSGKRIILDDPPKGWKINTSKNLLQASVSSPDDNEIDLTKDYGENISKVDGAKVGNNIDLEIIGNEINNSLKGGAGNDTLNGGGTNDTLTGGKGDDVFFYSGGDDLITDYGTGNDSICMALDDNTILDVEINGKNIVYYTNEGNFTVQGGKDKDIILMDENKSPITAPNASKNVAENIWFLEDDDNFVANDLDSITESKFEVTNFENEKYFALEQNNQTFLTYGKEK